MTPRLVDEVRIGASTAPSRALFGPHVTNLGSGRAISERHAAYYGRRARGGCGVIVTEVASVHESDWPYERAPLASECGPGWAAVAGSCAAHGAIVLAGLGHAGMQGSTAWTQDVLWAPSLVPSVHTAEQPLVVGDEEIASLAEGFAAGASLAVRSGCDGVELNAGQHSLLRQFCSGLTNQRADRFGSDRATVLREVLATVRAAVGDGVVGLRLCVDELAPWAGITPEAGVALLLDVAPGTDYVCLVRGSIYTEAATHPDGHVEQGFNAAVTGRCAAALREAGSSALVCAQGSVVDVAVADRLLADGTCDLVEMTRAQIADPDLCRKVASGTGARIRPCVLCNQHCQVRDPRNPVVSCCVNPIAGHELDDAELDVDGREAPVRSRPAALVVGGGVAGLEVARLLARAGHRVTLAERTGTLGGALRAAARLPGRARLGALCTWLEAEVAAEGVVVQTGREVEPTERDGAILVVAAGAVAEPVALRDGDDCSVPRVDAADLADLVAIPGRVVVLDPVGGPVGVGAAELAAGSAAAVTLVTPDVVAGSQLAATGDLVAANARLAAAGVVIVRHAVPVGIAGGAVVVEDRFTGAVSRVDAQLVVDAGHRRAPQVAWPDGAWRVGDAVAPRGVLHAMLEARRTAVGVGIR